MKTIIKTIILAAASLFAAMSCRKETVGDSAGNVADGVRVISVQFDNSTKAVFGSDGLTPKFENNDKIRVSNSQKSEECTVTVSGTSATFTTTLSGTLTAIYPANAAVLASEAADAPIASSNNFKVLATQTGKVEDAIIAKATIADSSATFTGVTSLFEIAPPSGATSITITSLNKIDATTGRRSATANAAAINTTGADDVAKREITVSVVDCKAYVSLVPGVKLTDLSFDAGEAVGLKGILASKLGSYSNDTAPKAKYTINKENWHPYVTIGGKKWATMNIGANSSTEVGKYFMWGETAGLTSDKISSTAFPASKYYSADNNSWDNTKGFYWQNCPWTNANYFNQTNVFTKYVTSDQTDYWGKTGSPDGKTTLDLADDAANANWGGPWRMPTNEEFGALLVAASSQSWITNYNSSGVNGYLFTNDNYNSIFFPAAGVTFAFYSPKVGEESLYWASSLDDGSPSFSYYFFYAPNDSNSPRMRTRVRCSGIPVRALSE